MTILDCYNDILKSLLLSADKDGLITFTTPDGGSKPAVVEGRRLVLPTHSILKAGLTKDIQAFHPLSESLARKGVSPVMTYLAKVAKALLGTYVSRLTQRLMEVAGDPALYKDIPPDCTEYMAKVPNADEKTLKVLQRLIRAAVLKDTLVKVYLKNGGKYEGRAISRLCTIRFPIMDDLAGEETTLYGVKMTPKQKKTISALFHYILPFGDDAEEYSYGSDAKIAPYLDAFLNAWRKITTQLNKVVRRYEKLDLQLEPFDQKFFKHLDKFPDYYSAREIPPLPGNDGGLAKGEKSVEVTPSDSTPPPWEDEVVERHPHTPPTSQAPSRQRKQTMAEWLGNLNPTPQVQTRPMPPHQQVPQPYIPSWMPAPAPPVQQMSPYASAVAPAVPQMQQGYGYTQPGYGQPAPTYGPQQGYGGQTATYRGRGGYGATPSPTNGFGDSL